MDIDYTERLFPITSLERNLAEMLQHPYQVMDGSIATAANGLRTGLRTSEYLLAIIDTTALIESL